MCVRAFNRYIVKSGVVSSLDGSPVAYVNWDEGEPSAPTPGRTYCVRMSMTTGRWQTVGCAESQEGSFICKKLKGSPSPSNC